MFMNIDRKQIMETFIRMIDHISDKDYQMRVWIKGIGPECQAFDDAVCDFFDIGDPILEEYKEFGITEKQYELLIKFREEFDKFSGTHSLPEKFIDTSEWAKIMNLAKEVLKSFNYPKSGK